MKEKNIKKARKSLNKDINVQPGTYMAFCLYSGNYTVNLGKKKITRGKKKTEIEVDNILRGSDAVRHLLTENKMTDGYIASTYCYIKVPSDKLDDYRIVLEQLGKVQISKYEPKPPAQKKEKKPTNNTDDVKKEAKQKRKEQNSLKTRANRGKGIGTNKKKTMHSRCKMLVNGEHKFPTTLEKRRVNRAKAIGKALLKKADMVSKKPVNIAKKKSNKPKQQKLNLVA